MSEIREETLPAGPGKGMRLLRYSVFTLLVISVAGIGAKVVSQSAQIVSLQTALGQVPGRDAVQQELDKLNGQVISNSETLKKLSASLEEARVAPVVDKTTFDRLAQQVRTLETKVSQPVSSDVQALQGVQATMALLQARIDTLEQRAGTAQTPATKPATAVANPTPTVKKNSSRSTHVRAVAAPFRLTSIERREGRCLSPWLRCKRLTWPISDWLKPVRPSRAGRCCPPQAIRPSSASQAGRRR